MKITSLLGAFLVAVLVTQALAQDYQQINLTDLTAFQPTAANWSIAGEASADLFRDEVVDSKKGTGVLVNQPTEKNRGNIVTLLEHGDLDLELEFMMARHSNSGIYLQGRYEVQLLDSWGKKAVTSGDCGGIYERWDESHPEGRNGYEGTAPLLNACRAPGLWQKLEISFRAPRFDQYGNKTENARILRVFLNGVVIHENVELTGPTRGGAEPEVAAGPILIQGDHGPVAFRNIRYRSFDTPPLQVIQWRYADYEYAGAGFPAPARLSVRNKGVSDRLTHEVLRGVDEDFLLLFEGEVDIAAPGRYHFDLEARGFGQLRVDGQTVISPTWWEGAGTIELSRGKHRLEVSYYKPDSWYPSGLGLYVGGPGIRRHPLHVESSVPLSSLPAPIYVDYHPEPVLLRSFVDFRNPGDSVSHRLTHAIAVGYPEDLCFGYDLLNGALFQVWRGGFLDVTPMWNDRGDGSSRPRGSATPLGDLPALAMLSTDQASWPDSISAEAGFRSRGYRLDDKGRPTFRYEIYGAAIEDYIAPVEGTPQLKRTLTLTGTPRGKLYHRLGYGNNIEALKNNLYCIDKRYYVLLPEKTGLKVSVRQHGDRQELVAAMEGVQKIEYQLIW